MASNVNKPTGLGYQGSPYRRCTACGHFESSHYGQRCFYSKEVDCRCRSFCARELTAKEKRIIEEQHRAAAERELEYVGEALYQELKREHPSDTRDY